MWGRPIAPPQRTDRREGDQPFHAQGLEGVDVGAEVQLAGQDPVTATVPGQERHAPTPEFAEHEELRRGSERRRDRPFFVDVELLHAVEAGAADDPDREGVAAHAPPPRAIVSLTSRAVSSARRPAAPSTNGRSAAGAAVEERLEFQAQRFAAFDLQIGGENPPRRPAGGVRLPAADPVARLAPSASGSRARRTGPRRRPATRARAPPKRGRRSGSPRNRTRARSARQRCRPGRTARRSRPRAPRAPGSGRGRGGSAGRESSDRGQRPHRGCAG